MSNAISPSCVPPIMMWLLKLQLGLWLINIKDERRDGGRELCLEFSKLFPLQEITVNLVLLRGPIGKIKILWEHYITGESLRQLYVIYLYFYLQLYDLIYRCGAIWKRSEINMLRVYDLYNSWYTTMLYVSRIMHLNWVFLEVPLVSLQ
jgi:hypothetical protein